MLRVASAWGSPALHTAGYIEHTLRETGVGMSKATMKVSSEAEGWSALMVSCTICPYTTFTSRRTGQVPTADEILAEHLAQHEQGRALDIEVDWEPSACCPVCPDGIGRITWDSDAGEGLICLDCKSTWDIEGKGGETRIEEEA